MIKRNSILLSKYIKIFLESDSDLMSMIPISKFYYLLADEGTTYPFVLMTRTSVSADGTKDGFYEDDAVLNVKVVDDFHHYNRNIEIANKIRHVLETHQYGDENIKITNIRLVNASEQPNGNEVVQSMDFRMKIS